jgi:hypothetical protein
MPGRWVNPPPGVTFSPWVFVRRDDGTLWYAPGVWRGEKGEVVGPPAAEAVAAVEAGEVVNADGTTSVTGPTLRPSRLEAPPANGP